MLVGRGSTKRSGSNSRQQQITQKKRKGGGGGGGLATQSGALFIHLLYLGKSDRFHKEQCGFNVLFKCIQQKRGAFKDSH